MEWQECRIAIRSVRQLPDPLGVVPIGELTRVFFLDGESRLLDTRYT
jgi:hypothetical protein